MKRTHHSTIVPFPVTAIAVAKRKARWRTKPLRDLVAYGEDRYIRENRPTFPVRSVL